MVYQKWHLHTLPSLPALSFFLPSFHPPRHTLLSLHTHFGLGLTAAWYCCIWCCGWASWLGADSPQHEAVLLSMPVNPVSLQLHDLTFASNSSSVPAWKIHTPTHKHTHINVFEDDRYCNCMNFPSLFTLLEIKIPKIINGHGAVQGVFIFFVACFRYNHD